jgi:hypothetical protein
MKQALKRAEKELKDKSESNSKVTEELKVKIEEGLAAVNEKETEIKIKEANLEAQIAQRKSMQMELEMTRKVKKNELDIKLTPLLNEIEKTQENLVYVKESYQELH